MGCPRFMPVRFGLVECPNRQLVYQHICERNGFLPGPLSQNEAETTPAICLEHDEIFASGARMSPATGVP